MEFWQQLYKVFRTNGDWGALKKAFMQVQVAETTGRNLQRLITCLETAAKAHEKQKRLFKCLARMLDVEACEWKTVRQFLEKAEAVPTQQRRTRHMRGKTTDSGNWLTRHVEEVSVSKVHTAVPEEAVLDTADLPPFVPFEADVIKPRQRPKHARVRSADQASLPIEYRMSSMSTDSPGRRPGLRKISEACNEGEESPSR